MVVPLKAEAKLPFNGRKPFGNNCPLEVSIPTPQAPATAAQVTDILTQISSATRRGDSIRCVELLSTIKALASENELNRIIIELAPSMPGIAATDGLVEAMVEMIKQPNSAKLTKATLVAIFYLVSSNREVAARFAELGIVSTLLDMLVDAEKSICEKVIGVLDRMFGNEKAREAAFGNALVVPLLVKKMYRVSEAATEFAVSALWKLCREEGRGRGCVVEALQVGAFQKVLLLLQVGCSEGAKRRASSLLKILNASKGEFECVDSMDFRGIKRPL